MTGHQRETLTIRLEPSVRDALTAIALRKRRDPLEYMASVLTEHALEEGGVEDEDEAKRLRLAESLMRRAIDVAIDIVRKEGWSPEITLKTAQVCTAIHQWKEDYATLIGADIYDTGNRIKASFNRRLGNRIKATFGADSQMEDDQPATVFVRGEIIRSYTPLLNGTLPPS